MHLLRPHTETQALAVLAACSGSLSFKPPENCVSGAVWRVATTVPFTTGRNVGKAATIALTLAIAFVS